MSTPLVSIIVPTYNHEVYIGACLESISAQRYPHWEAVVIDDGSTDGTWKVVQRYAEREGRIRAFRQERRGLERLVETYNFALALAEGDLVAILEGDDLWPPDKLAHQALLHASGARFSCGRTRIVGSAGERITEFKPRTPPGRYSFAAFFKEYALRRPAVIPVSVMMTRRALLELGGFVQKAVYPAVDVSTFIALFTAQPDAELVFTDHILGYWRSHALNTTKVREAAIVSGAYQLALGGLEALPEGVRRELRLNKNDIFRAHEPYLSGVYLSLMRQGLLGKKRAQALEYAERLWALGHPKRRAQALYGLALARVGLDMEHLFRGYERVRALSASPEERA